MEVFRTIAADGRVWRIYDDNPFWHIYSIEYMKTFESGSISWMPAFEPKNKIFNDLEEAKKVLDDLIKNN